MTCIRKAGVLCKNTLNAQGITSFYVVCITRGQALHAALSCNMGTVAGSLTNLMCYVSSFAVRGTQIDFRASEHDHLSSGALHIGGSLVPCLRATTFTRISWAT